MIRYSRYRICLLCLSFIFSVPLISQLQTEWRGKIRYQDNVEIVLNLKSPLNKRAGRVLRLEERLRITDTGGEFYFKYPHQLEMTSDGSFFVADIGELLKFKKDGRFVNNLIKKGQGPGEFEQFGRFSLQGKGEIYAFDQGQMKVVRLDLDGQLIEETKLPEAFGSCEGMTDHWLVFYKFFRTPPKDQTFILSDRKNVLTWVPRQGEAKQRAHTFLSKIFGGPGFAMTWDEFRSVLDREREFIFFSCTREYQVELLDLNRGTIVRSFKRDYPRVKYTMKERDKEIYKKYHPPEKKYESDILNLFISDGKLWVQTSTEDKKRGFLIDVFNAEGEYLDNFYLPVKGSILALQGDSIFIIEKDENDLVQIAHYRLIGL